MARIKLEDAIRELASDGNKPGASTSFLGCELNWLNNEIHLLDHRKGEAEKTRARILEELHAAADRASAYEQLSKTDEELGEMQRLHDEYVDRLGRLRDRIVSQIDELTESQQDQS
jgi:predicted  nucleic acid-binding Zn-ribbon protein